MKGVEQIKVLPERTPQTTATPPEVIETIRIEEIG